MKNGWMVRAGEGGYLISDFENAGCVAIGWNELGDMANISSKEQLQEKFIEAYPDKNEAQIRISTDQAHHFRFGIKIGDTVVSYDTDKREYLVGEEISNYEYSPKKVSDYSHVIRVEWRTKVLRDNLSADTRNSLCYHRSVFPLPGTVLDEFLGFLNGTPRGVSVPESEDEVLENITESSKGFIEDNLLKLSWKEMQDLVAGILRAMGYATKVSPPGPDGGRDITASPDGLGIREPRILVQVKHRPRDKTGADTIRGFIQILRGRYIGLFVSTGGFSPSALREAGTAQTPVTLINREELVNLYTQYYEKLDNETKALLPLVRIYWPG